MQKINAIAIFNYAHSYAASALALHRTKRHLTHPDAPVDFLALHAIELYFKAYLTACGLEERELRKKKYGHNVCCLANEAEARGLRLDEADKQLVLNLSETDNFITTRYIRVGLHKRVPFDALYEACCRLHSAILPMVYEESGLSCWPTLEEGPLAIDRRRIDG